MINVLKLKPSERLAIKRVAEKRGYVPETVRIKRDGTVWAKRQTVLGPDFTYAFIGFDLQLVREGLNEIV
jgi:hypothetical protein